MARSITLTLGVGLGADLGPNFNLTADVGSVTPSTATKIELLSPGKVVSVDDLATQVTVTSTGTCTNAITQTIPCAGGTTTTTTSTSTTTAAPGTTSTTTTTTAASTNFLISDGFASPQECYGLGGPYPNSVYAASSVWYDPGGPYVTRFFTNSGMTTGFNGGSLYYGDQYSTFGTTLQIDNDGYVIGYVSC